MLDREILRVLPDKQGNWLRMAHTIARSAQHRARQAHGDLLFRS